MPRILYYTKSSNFTWNQDISSCMSVGIDTDNDGHNLRKLPLMQQDLGLANLEQCGMATLRICIIGIGQLRAGAQCTDT